VQSLAVVQPEDKRDALRRLISAEDVKNALIFCNRKRDVDILFRSLSRHGLDAAALHGDMSQPKRTETLERFRNGEIRLLVASDVAARGLDIQGLSHVFCFDVPIHAEDYVHRIGRTGRAGRLGRSLMLAAPEDGRAVAAIVKLIGRDIPMVVVPGIADAELEYNARRGRGTPRPARPDHRPPSGNGEAGARAAAGRRSAGRDRRPAAPQAQLATGNGSNITPFPPAAEVRKPRQQERKREEKTVVGFGDDLPAFLARPSRSVARP